MYGMPIKKDDPDCYRGKGLLKKTDFVLGFLGAAAVWFFLFGAAWWLGPLVIFCAAAALIGFKVERRYFAYGMFGLVFFPLAIWGSWLWLRGK